MTHASRSDDMARQRNAATRDGAQDRLRGGPRTPRRRWGKAKAPALALAGVAAVLTPSISAPGALGSRSIFRGPQAVTFTAPTDLSSPTGDSFRPAVAVNPTTTEQPGAQYIVATWDGAALAGTPPKCPALSAWFDQSTFNANLGSWGAQETFATDDPRGSDCDPREYPITTQVGIDTLGNQTALAVRYDPAQGYDRLVAYKRAKDGPSWGSGTVISPLGCRAHVASYGPALSVALGGPAAALWRCEDVSQPGRYSIWLARRTSFSGSWTAGTNLSSADCPYPAMPVGGTVDINNTGNVVMAWTCRFNNDDDTTEKVQARLYKASFPAGLTNVVTLDNGGKQARGPDVAIDASCKAYMVYRQGQDYETGIEVQFRQRSPSSCTDFGASWINPSAEPYLSTPDRAAFIPRIAVNNAGDIVTVWHEQEPIERNPDGWVYGVRARVRQAGDTDFRSIQPLSSGSHTGDPVVDSSCYNEQVAIEESSAGGGALIAFTCADNLPAPVETCEVSSKSGAPYCWRVRAATYDRATDTFTTTGYISPENIRGGHFGQEKTNPGGDPINPPGVAGGSPRVAVGSNRGVIVYGLMPPRPGADLYAPYHVIQAVRVNGL